MHSSTASTKWETRVQRKRAALTVAIPAEWRLTTVPTISERSNVVELPKEVLSDEEIIITETPAVAVLANVHALVWSAEEVTRAFCHRAAIAHQLVNCLTEVLFDEAIVTAQELDRYYQMSGRLKGPLHGLPISFMDRFRISGAETSSGFVSWLGPKEATDAEGPLVRHLRSLGAVPICKTNVPQSMMLGNTTNNIFGSTLNPYNRCLSAGGAAGGEGALLAMRGSPFGWTTEIAGSTRIPATFNNLFGLKTSLGRLPTLGVASSNTTLPIGNATIGMLAPDLGSLLHISRLTLGSSAYQEDPAWLDLPWRENKFLRCHLQKRQPTFAILMDDGHVQPQPPIKRALDTVAQVLRSHGYEILEWRPPAHSPAVETLFRMIGADGAHEIRAHIERSGEPPVEKLRKWFADRRSTESMSVGDYWALSKARTDYIASYQSYWRSTAATTLNNQSVDGVIMPITAHSACFENELNYFGYSAIVNHLDFTSVAFPVTFVDQSVDVRAAQHKIWNDEDARIQASYDPVLQHGMPVGLQVMCRRIEEEVALTLTQVIMQTCGLS